MSGESSPERPAGSQAEVTEADHAFSFKSADYPVKRGEIKRDNKTSSSTPARQVRRTRNRHPESSNGQTTEGTTSAVSESRIQSLSQGGSDSGLPSSASFATGGSSASAGHTSGQDSGIHNHMDASINTGHTGGESRADDDDHGPESIPYQSVNEPDSPPSGRNTSSQRKNTKK